MIGTPNTAPEKTTTGAQIPNGTTTYTRFYTGDLKPDAKNNSLVPDYGSGQPNLQTIWLEKTLAEARRDRSVDMIVVFMHQCAMSTSVPGNGSDLGIRQAWLPLFDKYAVVGSEATGFTKNGADSAEDAPWSAAINPTDAYGYSIFDVDPGSGPGETAITFQYFAVPAVSNEAGTAHDGTTTLPTTPTEKLVFGRKVGRR